MALTQEQLDYLGTQRLGRLATAGADGRPHVVPVGFFVNRELGTIDIGGHGFRTRKKFRDVQQNPYAALVVDDLVSVDPWTPRMLEVRGRAEALPTGGAQLMRGFDDAIIRIHPDRVVAYNLDAGQPRMTSNGS